MRISRDFVRRQGFYLPVLSEMAFGSWRIVERGQFRSSFRCTIEYKRAGNFQTYWTGALVFMHVRYEELD